MIFTFLYYEQEALKMKTFTVSQKEEALEWHRNNPEAVMLLGSKPLSEDYDLEFLNGYNPKITK